MKNQLGMVSKFQKAFGQKIELQPTLVSESLSKLRYDLMDEENIEYLQACQDGDLVEVADALADQLYILCSGKQYW